MIAHNVQHGPFNEDARQQHISALVLHFCRNTKHADESFLFSSFLSRTIHALDLGSERGDPGIGDRMLQHFKDENPFRTKGSKVNYNRFMGAIKKGMSVAPQWPFRAFAFALLVLDTGMVSEAKLTNT